MSQVISAYSNSHRADNDGTVALLYHLTCERRRTFPSLVEVLAHREQVHDITYTPPVSAFFITASALQEAVLWGNHGRIDMMAIPTFSFSLSEDCSKPSSLTLICCEDTSIDCSLRIDVDDVRYFLLTWTPDP
jgi:hypothetical protein